LSLSVVKQRALLFFKSGNPSGNITLTFAYLEHARFAVCGFVLGKPVAPRKKTMAGKKILVVEDEAVQLTSVARRLKSPGYEVVGARDGASAISTARKELPDLVLLDLGLPPVTGSLS
jgi:PleD family two-component response regulator